jgi:hypothetical protein
MGSGLRKSLEGWGSMIRSGSSCRNFAGAKFSSDRVAAKLQELNSVRIELPQDCRSQIQFGSSRRKTAGAKFSSDRVAASLQAQNSILIELPQVCRSQIQSGSSCRNLQELNSVLNESIPFGWASIIYFKKLIPKINPFDL